jgi:hypothetical protein
MAVTPAGFALFLDVADFAAGRHLTITADDAAARQCGEPEKSNKAHDVSILSVTDLSKPCTVESTVIVTFTWSPIFKPVVPFRAADATSRIAVSSVRLDSMLHRFGY